MGKKLGSGFSIHYFEAQNKCQPTQTSKNTRSNLFINAMNL